MTRLLDAWRRGDRDALQELTPIVYVELRKVARSYMRRERPNHTLQTAGLVNEAYLRLVGQDGVEWRDRAHFFGVASNLMRQILVDHARARDAAKRGGGVRHVSLSEAADVANEREVDLLALDQVLRRLEAIDAEQSRIIELRYFGGLTIEEIADVVGKSPATIKREWTAARAWLYRALTSG